MWEVGVIRRERDRGWGRSRRNPPVLPFLELPEFARVYWHSSFLSDDLSHSTQGLLQRGRITPPTGRRMFNSAPSNMNI